MLRKERATRGILYFRTLEEAQAAEARIRAYPYDLGFRHVTTVHTKPSAFVFYQRILEPDEPPVYKGNLVEERDGEIPFFEVVSKRLDLVFANKREHLYKAFWGDTRPKPITLEERQTWCAEPPAADPEPLADASGEVYASRAE
jgi:hypothetical protein